jgi:phosphoglycerate dehydrogenase-like enzyme
MKISTIFTALILLLVGAHGTAQVADFETLIDELGLQESAVASREMPGWQRPGKVTVLLSRPLPESGPGSADWYTSVADGVEIDFVDLDEDGVARLTDSDAYLGWCNADVLNAGKKLKYVHIYSAGIDNCSEIPGIADRGLIATNSAKAASETIAEHSIALMLALTRNLHYYWRAQADARWTRRPEGAPDAISVKNKTMLVLGLGGIGSQVAERAANLGMRVIGTRNSSRNGPDYVDHVGLSDEMYELAAQADVIFNALPLTDDTAGIVDARFFDGAKNGSWYINVGRGDTTDTGALIAALKSGKLAGAGLDVTDPEPLPDDHELWTLPNVIITPHTASSSDLSGRNTLLLARENLRRYVRGEKLLNMVDLARGY